MSHTHLDCECVGDHNPNNTEPDLHHIWPLALGGPDTPDNIVAICPNQHRLVHQLLREYRKLGATPPWRVRRHFSAFTRALAADGWSRYTTSQGDT